MSSQGAAPTLAGLGVHEGDSGLPISPGPSQDHQLLGVRKSPSCEGGKPFFHGFGRDAKTPNRYLAGAVTTCHIPQDPSPYPAGCPGNLKLTRPPLTHPMASNRDGELLSVVTCLVGRTDSHHPPAPWLRPSGTSPWGVPGVVWSGVPLPAPQQPLPAPGQPERRFQMRI